MDREASSLIQEGKSSPPSPPPRVICHEALASLHESPSVTQACAEVLEESHTYPPTAIIALCAAAASAVVSRELTRASAGDFDPEATLQLVLAMLQDEHVMIPEIRQTLLMAQKRQWAFDSNSKDVTFEMMSALLFGAGSIEGQDYPSAERTATKGRLGLVRFSDESRPTLLDVQVSQNCRLSPQEWAQKHRNSLSNLDGNIFIFQLPGSNGWTLAFPVVTEKGSAIRRRLMLLPTKKDLPELPSSCASRALRDMVFYEGGDDHSPLDEDDRREPDGVTDITVDRLMNSLVVAFVLATSVKLYLFYVRCGGHARWHSGSAQEVGIEALGVDVSCSATYPIESQISAAESSHGSLSWLVQMAACFLYGPPSGHSK